MSIRVVIFGTSTFGIPSFERILVDPRFSVVAVVTQPAKPTGRHQTLTETPVGIWAGQHRLTILTPKSLKPPEVQDLLRSYAADVFLVASYGLILPASVLEIPTFGCLNIHASLLPAYRGASPIAAALMHGDTTTGITFMAMDAGCDTGPILRQENVSIQPTDTRQTLEDRLAGTAAEYICDVTVDWHGGTIIPKPQPNEGVSLAPRLSRQDGRVVWDDAVRIERQIRALQPWPGVWTTWKAQEIKILAAHVAEGQPTQPVGTIVPLQPSWGIACSNGYLIPDSVQFAGKKPQPASAIPGSYPTFLGAQLV